MNLLKVLIAVREITSLASQIISDVDASAKFEGKSLLDMTDQELATLLEATDIRNSELIVREGERE
jgi:hypothetical protein